MTTITTNEDLSNTNEDTTMTTMPTVDKARGRIYDKDEYYGNIMNGTYCPKKTLTKQIEEAIAEDYTGYVVLTPKVTPESPVIDLTGINKSAIISTMGSELFQQGLNVQIAMIAATAFVGAIDYHEDHDLFLEAFTDGLEITSLEVIGGPVSEDIPLDGEEIVKAMVDAKYLLEDLTMGERLAQLVELRSEAYMPVLHSDGITRRFGYAPTKVSPLFREFIHALEDSPYTVDMEQLEVETQVAAIIGEDQVKAFYALVGSAMLDPNLAYISEYKGDRRLRAYHASCHGPNGQASDMERALMNLHGVPMDYDAMEAFKHLKEEMADMVSTKSVLDRVELVRDANNDPVKFIIYHDKRKDDAKLPTICSKAHSFVKAARTLKRLHNHIHNGTEKPYIGMAFGKDAKCSGPQIGSLMVGDQELAAACGFSMEQVADAYHRAIKSLEESGFEGLEREDIKKPFMGIFYGQGVAAYRDPLNEDIQGAVWYSMYGDDFEGMSENQIKSISESFHDAVVASFGSKMVMVRNAFLSYNKKIEGKVKHLMPDGCEVAMNYKEKVNALGMLMTWDTPKYDIRLTNNAETYKFNNFQMNTKHVSTSDFIRNGFVNMIQATDALVARLIVVHAKRLGVKHIISVHDCFRVNVTQIGLLDEAIKLTYLDLFGTKWNESSDDLPLGLDILGMYFDGINKQLIDGMEGTRVSQFFNSGLRRIQKVKGIPLPDLINSLGTTYYFDK